METPQFGLFDDAEKPQSTRSIVQQPQPGTPLSKSQRAFNRLVARIEALRVRLESERRRLEDALAFHAGHIRPRVERLAAMRKDVVRAFRPFLQERSLSKSDRKALRAVLAEQLDELFAVEGPVDEDMCALFEQLRGANVTALEQEQMDEARFEMEAMFAALGLEVDLSDIRPGMSDEELAAKLAEKTDDIRRQAEEAEASARAQPPRTKRELKEAARARQADELRRKSIGTIYRQLAKVLHPDLEPDPDARQRKSTLMQEVTAAYANNDLHKLLRLELEWIQREEADVTRLTEQKLHAYNQLLKEQAAELESDLAELPFHPRYQPLFQPAGPFGVQVRIDWSEDSRWLDAAIDSFEQTLARIRSGQAWQEVRGAIRAHRAARGQRY